MLNIVITEDDSIQLQAITGMLKSIRPGWRIVATARTGLEAIDLVERYEPDFVLLDIGLAGPKTGLDVAHEIGRHCPIVFITGEMTHAIDAFDLGAVDYIVKPVSVARLEKASARIEQVLRAGMFSGRNAPRMGEELSGEIARYVQLSSGKKLIWAPTHEIRYLQAEGGYTRVFLEATSGVIRLGLQNVLHRLDPLDFWQIHRGMIINARFVHELERDEMSRLSVRLRGYPKPFPVSKNQERLFRENIVV